MKPANTSNNTLRIVIGISFFVLAFLIEFFVLGGNLEYFGSSFAMMLCVSLIMTLIPAIAWLISHRSLGKKKGLTICIINSALPFLWIAIWQLLIITNVKPCAPYDSICSVPLAWKILIVSFFFAILSCAANICFWVDLKK